MRSSGWLALAALPCLLAPAAVPGPAPAADTVVPMGRYVLRGAAVGKGVDANAFPFNDGAIGTFLNATADVLTELTIVVTAVGEAAPAPVVLGGTCEGVRVTGVPVPGGSRFRFSGLSVGAHQGGEFHVYGIEPGGASHLTISLEASCQPSSAESESRQALSILRSRAWVEGHPQIVDRVAREAGSSKARLDAMRDSLASGVEVRALQQLLRSPEVSAAAQRWYVEEFLAHPTPIVASTAATGAVQLGFVELARPIAEALAAWDPPAQAQVVQMFPSRLPDPQWAEVPRVVLESRLRAPRAAEDGWTTVSLVNSARLLMDSPSEADASLIRRAVAAFEQTPSMWLIASRVGADPALAERARALHDDPAAARLLRDAASLVLLEGSPELAEALYQRCAGYLQAEWQRQERGGAASPQEREEGMSLLAFLQELPREVLAGRVAELERYDRGPLGEVVHLVLAKRLGGELLDRMGAEAVSTEVGRALFVAAEERPELAGRLAALLPPHLHASLEELARAQGVRACSFATDLVLPGLPAR